ncbi:hypothetical protein BH23CHL4_BH23CHL4_20630 [soil metagenome]
MALSGDSGFEVTGDVAGIFGATTTIDVHRLKFDLDGMTYSAVPAVVDGEISLQEIDVDRNIAAQVISGAALTNGLESGINKAMISNGRGTASLAHKDGITVTFAAAA